MDILFIGKRFYTNRDAYTEKFGRIYQLPYYWSKENETELWLIDYHSKEEVQSQDEKLKITSTPILTFIFVLSFFKFLFKKPRIIVASGDCYIGLLSFILAKITSAKFVFDIYDKYDAFEGYRNLGFNNLLSFLIKKADLNLFASRILAKEKGSLTPYYIVQNGVDYNNFQPINQNIARSFFDIKPYEKIVGYIGSLEKERGIEDLILAVEKLGNIKLLIAGKNSHNINLAHDFIYYLGNINFNSVPKAISSCDILAIPYRRSEQINYGTSCKIAEYIAMEKPIVATESANLFEDFPQYREILPLNYIAECNNPENLAEAINKQINHPILLNKLDSLEWYYISSKTLTYMKSIF